MSNFSKYQEQQNLHKEMKKVAVNNHTLAKFFANGVAIAGIVALSVIFATTTSKVFESDPTLHTVGIAFSMIVGASSIVFLVFKNDLLHSKEQFWVACAFVAAEIFVLTLGAVYSFSIHMGWQVEQGIADLTKWAIMLTFPMVVCEWLVVLALDPKAKEKRHDNHSASDKAAQRRNTKDVFYKSDPVVEIHEAAALSEVLTDEINSLAPQYRPLFIEMLRTKYKDNERLILILNKMAGDNRLLGAPSTPQMSIPSSVPDEMPVRPTPMPSVSPEMPPVPIPSGNGLHPKA